MEIDRFLIPHNSHWTDPRLKNGNQNKKRYHRQRFGKQLFQEPIWWYYMFSERKWTSEKFVKSSTALSRRRRRRLRLIKFSQIWINFVVLQTSLFLPSPTDVYNGFRLIVFECWKCPKFSLRLALRNRIMNWWFGCSKYVFRISQDFNGFGETGTRLLSDVLNWNWR